MLFSSFYPKEIEKIPAPGHIVTYHDRLYPFKVEHRVIIEGNVLLQIRSDETFVARERLEILNWYPEPNDICVAAARPYLQWRRAYGDYDLPAWVQGRMKLMRVDGDFAIVLPTGKDEEVKRVPFQALRVKQKFLGKVQSEASEVQAVQQELIYV